MAEFAPSMERLRQVYVQSFVSGMPILARSTDAEKVIAGLAFDRALAAHDAEIRRDQAEKDAALVEAISLDETAPRGERHRSSALSSPLHPRSRLRRLVRLR